MECNQLVEEIKKRCFRLGLTEKVGKGRTQWSEEEVMIKKLYDFPVNNISMSLYNFLEIHYS